MSTEDKAPAILVMRGGGAKGLAYVGALEELEKKYCFKCAVGASAGAITALLVGFGFTAAELKGELEKKNFGDFLDGTWLQRLVNLFRRGGACRGDDVKVWINQLLRQKQPELRRDILLIPPQGTRVRIFASSRRTATRIFDSDKERAKETQDGICPAWYAVRASMTIPFIFTPHEEYGESIFDGGLRNNYPMLAIEEETGSNEGKVSVIGLYVYGSSPEEARTRSTFIQIIYDVFSIWQDSPELDVLERYRDQTIPIDTSPIGTLDFTLSADEKSFLVACGKLAVLQFYLKQCRQDANASQAAEKEVAQARSHKNALLERVLPICRKRKWWRQQKLRLIVITLMAGLLAIASCPSVVVLYLALFGCPRQVPCRLPQESSFEARLDSVATNRNRQEVNKKCNVSKDGQRDGGIYYVSWESPALFPNKLMHMQLTDEGGRILALASAPVSQHEVLVVACGDFNRLPKTAKVHASR